MVAGGAIAVGAAGAAVSGAAVRDRMRADKQARALASAGSSGDNRVDPKAILADATKAALNVRGTKTSDLLAGMAKFQSLSGDLQGARTHAQTIATTARATGASEEEIGGVAAMLSKSFGITDADQMKGALSKLTGMGKAGAFELASMATEFGGLGAAASRYGMRGEKGAMQIAGLAQLSREASGSGAQAATGTEAMLRQLVVNEKKVKSLTGTSVFTDSTKTQGRNIEDVLVETISGAKGSASKLQAIFGDEGSVGVSKLASVYNDATAAVGKNATEQQKQAAGIAAMREVLSKTINAGQTWGDTLADANQNTDTASDAMVTAWEQVSSQVGDALAPALKDLASNAPALGESFKTLTSAALGVVGGFNSVVAYLKDAGILKDKPKEEPSASPNSDLAKNRRRQQRLAEKGALTPEEQQQMAQLKSDEQSLMQAAKTPTAAGRSTVGNAVTGIAGAFGGGLGAFGATLASNSLDDAHANPELAKLVEKQQREKMQAKGNGKMPFFTQFFHGTQPVHADIAAEAAGQTRDEFKGRAFGESISAKSLFGAFSTSGTALQSMAKGTDMSGAESKLISAAGAIESAAQTLGSTKITASVTTTGGGGGPVAKPGSPPIYSAHVTSHSAK